MATTLDKNGNVIENGYSTNLSPTQFSTITADSLKTQTPVTIPPNNAQLVDLNAISTPITTGIANDYAALEKQLAQANNSQGQTGQGIVDIMSALTGKTSDLQQAQEQAGVNTETANLTKYGEQLANLNAQASALQREAQAIPIQVQQEATGRGVTEAGVAPLQAARLRENALRALSIGQQADIAAAAATGSMLRLNAAKEKAQQAVDLKYKPLEEQLAIKKQIYEMNKEQLASLDKKRAEALNIAIRKEERDLEEKKANEKAVSDMVTNARVQGVDPSLADRASKAKNASEAAAILGRYAGDYLSVQIKKAQLAKLGLENQEAYNKLYNTSPSGLRTLSYEENAKFNSTPEAKAVKDATAYAKAVADYKAAIEKYGTGELFGTGSGALGQTYSALVGATKDYYTLGTLDNGVQKLIALGIPEPGVLGLKKGRIDALDTALTAASDTIKRNTDQLLATNYKNTNELRQLTDNANSVLMYRLSNQDLLNSIPGASAGTVTSNSTNSDFFNK